MPVDYKILIVKNRISLLEARPKENGRIIQKLQRKLRNLENAAAGPETV